MVPGKGATVNCSSALIIGDARVISLVEPDRITMRVSHNTTDVLDLCALAVFLVFTQDD
jgi:hypothetical protein